MTSAVWSESFPGVVMPSCGDVDGAFEVHHRTGVSLRVAGEAFLCFDCGPVGGVYHPEAAREPDPDHDPERPRAGVDDVRRIAVELDARYNRFELHRHRTLPGGKDGPDLDHSHTDGSEPHRHPETAIAWFGHRGEGFGKPTQAPAGEQLEYVELTEAEATFRVVGPYRYINPTRSAMDVARWSGRPKPGSLKPPPESGRATWRNSMELVVWAARLRLYGHDPRLIGPGAVILAATRLSDDFRLTPIYEIEGWTPTPYRGLP